MQQVELTRSEGGELARAFATCGSLLDNPEPFLASVFPQVSRLPSRLLESLLRLRADPRMPGILLIRGMPLDAVVPPTPTATSAHSGKRTFISEASVLLVGLVLGEPFAYVDEKDGALVQNVFPVPGEARAPSNESSDTDLGFHTELSFSRCRPERPLHEACPDFLLLFGLRGAPHADAVTTLVESDDIRRLLPARTEAQLRLPIYQLRAPYSFTRELGTERPWSGPVPLVHGPPSATTIAFDLACGVRGTTPEAGEALDELRRIVATPDIHCSVRLDAGDLLVMDNRRCVHARSRFQARFDGTDRWLQRVYVRRTLDGLERANTTSFRVL
jgi:L-asparagine oxygenase